MVINGWSRRVAVALGTAAGFAAAAAAGVAVSRVAGNVASFWPANAVALGVLLRMSRPDVTGILGACWLANALLNLLIGDGPALAAGFATANMAETLVAWQIFARAGETPCRLDTPRQIVVLVAAAMVAPVAGAVLGAGLVNQYFAASFAQVWRNWWIGGVVGLLLVVPLVLSFDARRLRDLATGVEGPWRPVELLAAYLILGAQLWLLLIHHPLGSVAALAPVLLWLALRFGTGAAAAGAAMTAVAALAAIVHGDWPFGAVAAGAAPVHFFIALTLLPPLVAAVAKADLDRTRAARTQANARLDDAIASMADGLSMYDRDERLVLVNRRWHELYPQSTDLRVPGAHLFDIWREEVRRGLYPGVTPEQAESWIAERIRQSRTAGEEDRQLADGRWLHVRVTPTPGGGNVVTVRDVTERKRLDLQLVEAKGRLDDAIASMADGFVLLDAGNRIVACNERFRELFPLTADLRRPGVDMAEVLHAAALRGEEAIAAEDRDAWVARCLERIRQPSTRDIALTDGRTIEIRTRQAAEGGICSVLRDVTDRVRAQHELAHKAAHDPLTSLPNRRGFQLAFTGARAAATRAGATLAVLLVDLDHFKQVNDTLGHQAGDRLLTEVGRRLKDCLRDDDVVARLGGDEFAVLARVAAGSGAAAALAQRMVDAILAPLRLGDSDHLPSASVGVAIFPGDGDTIEALLASADRALYAAKRAGRGRWASRDDGERIMVPAGDDAPPTAAS